jgi:hypothetical protein
MFRPATSALRLGSTLPRTVSAIRHASAIPALTATTSETADPSGPNYIDFKAPGISHSAKAFVVEVPKSLPDNEFNQRRKAVEEHAYCEWVRRAGQGG